jgi:hypothetical protein
VEIILKSVVDPQPIVSWGLTMCRKEVKQLILSP